MDKTPETMEKENFVAKSVLKKVCYDMVDNLRKEELDSKIVEEFLEEFINLIKRYNTKF